MRARERFIGLTRVSNKELTQKCSVLAIGPSPPPFNGMSMMTDVLLNIRDNVHLIHLDTADRRDLSNIGKLDLVNVLHACRHGVRFLYLLLLKRPDVVYVPISQITLAFLRDCLFLLPARILGKNVVVHLHGGSFRRFYASSSAPMRWLIRLTLGRTTAMVLGRTLISIFDGIIPRDRVHIVPNGVPDLLREEIRDGAGDRPFTVLYLSLLVREKGVFDVLRAIPLVIERAHNCRFVFAGEWYRAEEMREALDIVRRLEIGRYVEFVGVAGPTAKVNLLNAADVFVLPSYNEGQPCAILEAMSVGLPIVTTNVGCIAETVIDGVNGFLVEEGSPAAIAEKVLLLHDEPAVMRRMQTASRKRFLSNYTMDEFKQRLTRLFTDRKQIIVNDNQEESALP
jgi:glycosyltransferase involved in cell wall biosynthesis